MLNQQTIEKLHALQMRGMADAFTQQQEEPQTTQLSFEERFALLVDRRGTGDRIGRWSDGSGMVGCKGQPAWKTSTFVRREVWTSLVRSLMNDSDWVRRHQHIFLVGPTGIGKTFLAKAFGQKACRDGFTDYFATAAQLFRELELARADGSFAKRLRGLGQVDVLIVDDWAMSPMADGERRAFLEICDERYMTRSTLLTSQLPVAKWHAQIGDPTVADSILDRLVHAAHRIDLQGEFRCGRRRAVVGAKMPNNGRIAKWFLALTPVALQAPYVSANNHKQPERRETPLDQVGETKQKS
jgi:hypothetical protein